MSSFTDCAAHSAILYICIEQRYARPDVDGASYPEGELSLLLLALQGPNGLRGRGGGGGLRE